MSRRRLILLSLLAWVLLSGALSADDDPVYVPTEAGKAKSQLAAFLEKFPKARIVKWPGADASPYKVYRSGKTVINVFDGAGALSYRQSVRAFEILPFDGLAIVLLPAEPKPGARVVNRYFFIGFAKGQPVRTTLPRGGRLALAPWLEDVDGNGKQEICLYEKRKLRCLRWNANAGKWEWIAGLEGKRIYRDAPPVRWEVRAVWDEAKRTLACTVKATSLTEKPLTLTPPVVPILERVPPRRRDGKPAFTARPKTPVSLACPRGWFIAPAGAKAQETVVLAAGRSAEFAFVVRPPRAQGVGERFAFDLVGRARWRRFDVTYDVSLTTRLAGEIFPEVAPGEMTEAHVVSGRVKQADVDRAVRALMEHRRHVPAEVLKFVSTDTRDWLVTQALAGQGGYTILKQDVSDATTRAILKGIAATAEANPRDAERLLWLALVNLDPDEYATALAQAGGAERLKPEILLRLLAYRGGLIERKALAQALASWPEESVAAEAKQVVAQPESAKP